jgi:hypothetical protein
MAMTADRPQQADDGVVPVRIVVRPEAKHWAVVALDYSVVGIGATPDEAVNRLCVAMREYLEICWREGMTLDQARRPARGRWRIELEARWVLNRLANRIRLALHRARRPKEVRVSVHDGRFASC